MLELVLPGLCLSLRYIKKTSWHSLCSYFDTWGALASLCFDPSFICYLDSKSVIRLITGNCKASKPDLYTVIDCEFCMHMSGCIVFYFYLEY